MYFYSTTITKNTNLQPVTHIIQKNTMHQKENLEFLYPMPTV